MNRIDQKFSELRSKGLKAFIAYITCGDPDLPTTEDLIVELAGRGVDMVELGVPFSDPLADGTTIQRASERALRGEVSLRDILALVPRLRKKKVQIPLILFSYYNPIHKYGMGDFVSALVKSEIDGVIVPDLPPEEGELLRTNLGLYGLDMAYLAAPTSTAERLRMIADRSQGFIYYVSRTGVTGVRKALEQKDIRRKVAHIRKVAQKPVVVGFGVSNPKHVRMIADMAADGVVVGSAIIDVIERNLGRKDLVKRTGDFVQGLVRAAKEV